MYSIEEFIIAVFCCVDDVLRTWTNNYPIRSRGFAPRLSDAEVLTMEIVGEYQGIETDKGIWRYFHEHWFSLFPQLPSRTSFVRQAANLWQYKQRLQHEFATQLGAFADDVHIVDGIPLCLCCLSYARRCRTFQGQADYGFCAAKDQFFYGFRGHLSISASGVITSFALTAANGDEREALWDLTEAMQGLLIGDKGYISQSLSDELNRVGISLQTPLRSNMSETRPKPWVRVLQSVRRLIETVNGQLAERFHFERIHARDLWHLTSRIARKLLAHTTCCWLNWQLKRPLLQFDSLIAD